MATVGFQALQPLPFSNGNLPKEGPKGIPAIFNFTGATQIDIDLTTQIQNAKISFIQSLYIDNSLNMSPLNIKCKGTNQTMTIGKQLCIYVPVLTLQPPQFSFATAGGVLINVFFLNFPLSQLIPSV